MMEVRKVNDKRMWMVRAGRNAVILDKFLKKNCVAIGWVDLGNLSDIKSKTQLVKKLKESYPDWSTGKIATSTGQVKKFRLRMNKGDYVITYDPGERIYHVGEIASDYEYKPNEIEDYPNLRKVKWVGKVDRDRLSVPTKNTVGALSTLFELGYDAKEEFLMLLRGESVSQKPERENEEYDGIKEDKIEEANEFIKDKIQKLDPYEMQDLFAGVLRAMGYKTRVSSRGSDRGKDIIASPDGLGLEDPRIIVEVKHRAGRIGANEMRSFITVIRSGFKGIYVSTGGFTKEAKFEAERSKEPMTVIDISDLVNLITQYYDSFDSETKTLLPLIKIYWPAR